MINPRPVEIIHVSVDPFDEVLDMFNEDPGLMPLFVLSMLCFATGLFQWRMSHHAWTLAWSGFTRRIGRLCGTSSRP